VLYENGQGVEKNTELSIQWCQQAADNGNVAAQYDLGEKYCKGTGVKQDYTMALKWYLKVAAQEDHRFSQYAKISIGILYKEGKGVEQDDIRAFSWFKQSAEQGNTTAQYIVAEMYETGKGIKQDGIQAVIWYHKSAEQENFDAHPAQYKLAKMYDEGNIVSQDEAQAIFWYRKVKDCGYDIPKEKLEPKLTIV